VVEFRCSLLQHRTAFQNMVIIKKTALIRCCAFIFTAFLVNVFRNHQMFSLETTLTTNTLSNKVLSEERIDRGVFPKVLIFITSHFSASHITFFQRCWPYSIAKSLLLQSSDILVFSNGATNRSLLQRLFAHNRLEIHEVNENPGYEKGANEALELAGLYGWFESYDWVIRLNPDVIIRNDTEILKLIMDPDLDGIFVNCLPGRGELLHTDWSAFRPAALPERKFASNRLHSEAKFTIDMKAILTSRSFVWLPHSHPEKFGSCRVVGDVVIHDHKYLNYCEEDLSVNKT
jgi:hypothetical protein